MATRRPRTPDRDAVGTFARSFAMPALVAPAAPHADPLVEPAWDGHRVIATCLDGVAKLVDSTDRVWTATFPQLSTAVAALGTSLAIDGVICALDDRGIPSHERLRAMVASKRAITGVVLICWDLLWLDVDLRDQPLRARRHKLAKLVGTGAIVVLSQELPSVDAARALGMAAVTRSRDATYAVPWQLHGTADYRRALSPPPPLTNADKILYPRDQLAKKDIVAYYRAVAGAMIPHLADRAVVIQRWPDGIDDFAWYQHRMPPRAPDYLRAAWVDGMRRIVVENVEALLWMVNQAGLTYHTFTGRLATPTEPDFAVIDLDPGERTTWRDITEIATAIRKILELLDLPSVVKTSGQRGLHILVPLAPGHTFEHCEQLGDGVARLLLQLMPERVTVELDKDKRRGRLYLDTRQHAAKTLVAPYSLRAVDGAHVSAPVGWDELHASTPPSTYTLRTLRARLDARGDLAVDLLRRDRGARLEPALSQLARQR